MRGFATPNSFNWTSYSAILREDFWESKYGDSVSQLDMINILKNVTSLRVRGDTHVCGHDGDGRESVYLNEVQLERDPNKGTFE